MDSDSQYMDLFSSLTIHGLVEFPNGNPISMTLSRGISFPPLLFSFSSKVVMEWKYDMRPRTPPSFGMHLELEIAQVIGRGRCGHVYDAKVVGVSSRPDLPASPPDFSLPPLCLKLAEPNRMRGFAREAWFYEKLDEMGLQGTIVPRAFGFFTSKCAHPQVVPWRQRDWAFHSELRRVKRLLEKFGYPCDDGLIPDDLPSHVWERLDKAQNDRPDYLRFEPEENKKDHTDDVHGFEHFVLYRTDF